MDVMKPVNAALDQYRLDLYTYTHIYVNAYKYMVSA